MKRCSTLIANSDHKEADTSMVVHIYDVERGTQKILISVVDAELIEILY